jgi:hypothetical protein
MAGTWFPRTEALRVIWLNNVGVKIPTYTLTFPSILTVPRLAALAADIAAWLYLVNESEIFRTHQETITDYKKQLMFGPGPIGAIPGNPVLGAPPTVVLANIVARLDALFDELKANSAYTTAIGNDIGIEPPPPGAASPLVPTGDADAQPGSIVRLNWLKGSWAGVYIECQRDDETTWVFLATDTHSPYVDNRPPLVAGQAEVRRYRMRYLSGDTPTTDWSDVITVSTIP